MLSISWHFLEFLQRFKADSFITDLVRFPGTLLFQNICFRLAAVIEIYTKFIWALQFLNNYSFLSMLGHQNLLHWFITSLLGHKKDQVCPLLLPQVLIQLIGGDFKIAYVLFSVRQLELKPHLISAFFTFHGSWMSSSILDRKVQR